MANPADPDVALAIEPPAEQEIAVAGVIEPVVEEQALVAPCEQLTP